MHFNFQLKNGKFSITIDQIYTGVSWGGLGSLKGRQKRRKKKGREKRKQRGRNGIRNTERKRTKKRKIDREVNQHARKHDERGAIQVLVAPPSFFLNDFILF